MQAAGCPEILWCLRPAHRGRERSSATKCLAATECPHYNPSPLHSVHRTHRKANYHQTANSPTFIVVSNRAHKILIVTWLVCVAHCCRVRGYRGKVKVRCTLVQALRLCTCRTTHRGSRDIPLLFLDRGTRRG